MIRYLERSDIDSSRWDTSVSNAINSSLFAKSWYLDITCPGWSALVDDDYEALFPIPNARKAGISYVYTPTFIPYLGLYSEEEITDKKIDEFIDFIPEEFSFIDLSVDKKPSSFKGNIVARWTQRLKLHKNPVEIRTGYSSDCRRNIKLAMKEKPDFVSDVQAGDFIKLFKSGAGLKMGLRKLDINRLEELISNAAGKGVSKIQGYKSDGRLIYAAVTLLSEGSLTLILTATSEMSRLQRTGYLFIDRLVEEYAGNDLTLDFAGSSIKGIADYNKSFGADSEEYYRLYLNRLPWPVRYFKRLGVR